MRNSYRRFRAVYGVLKPADGCGFDSVEVSYKFPARTDEEAIRKAVKRADELESDGITFLLGVYEGRFPICVNELVR